jgi:hypothetical protein
MKSNILNTNLGLIGNNERARQPAHSFKSTAPASTIQHLHRSLPLTLSNQTMDEPRAVFALGNFFGSGELFVSIPWQSLQLTKPSKTLRVKVFPDGIVSRKLERMIVTSLEIKRDVGGCIRVIARKPPHQAP